MFRIIKSETKQVITTIINLLQKPQTPKASIQKCETLQVTIIYTFFAIHEFDECSKHLLFCVHQWSEWCINCTFSARSMVFDELQQTNNNTQFYTGYNIDFQFTNNVVCCLKDKFKNNIACCKFKLKYDIKVV